MKSQTAAVDCQARTRLRRLSGSANSKESRHDEPGHWQRATSHSNKDAHSGVQASRLV